MSSLLVESEYELGKEKVKPKAKKKVKEVRENSNYAEFEFADDAISLNNENFDDRPPSSASIGSNKSQHETSFTENPYITVNGKEELPCVEEIKNYNYPLKEVKTESNCNNKKVQVVNDNIQSRLKFDGNYNKLAISKIYSYCTLPKRKNGNNQKGVFHSVVPPKRITPDGTHIYYWCDLQKKCANGKQFKHVSGDRLYSSTNTIIPNLQHCFRAGRRRLQPSLDNAGFHPNFPLLEGKQESPIRSIKCIPHLRHVALVEHR